MLGSPYRLACRTDSGSGFGGDRGRARRPLPVAGAVRWIRVDQQTGEGARPLPRHPEASVRNEKRPRVAPGCATTPLKDDASRRRRRGARSDPRQSAAPDPPAPGVGDPHRRPEVPPRERRVLREEPGRSRATAGRTARLRRLRSARIATSRLETHPSRSRRQARRGLDREVVPSFRVASELASEERGGAAARRVIAAGHADRVGRDRHGPGSRAWPRSPGRCIRLGAGRRSPAVAAPRRAKYGVRTRGTRSPRSRRARRRRSRGRPAGRAASSVARRADARGVWRTRSRPPSRRSPSSPPRSRPPSPRRPPLPGGRTAARRAVRAGDPGRRAGLEQNRSAVGRGPEERWSSTKSGTISSPSGTPRRARVIWTRRSRVNRTRIRMASTVGVSCRHGP